MKLLFLTASLEPGRDGVGDYTRILAGAVRTLGHECRLIAFRDQHLQRGDEFETQDGLPALRLGAALSWTERRQHIQKLTETFSPDAICFQIVPWGFDPRGIIPKEADAIAGLFQNARRYAMLHELWLGLPQGDTLKHIAWGWLQRRALMRFVRRLAPHTIQTTNAPYQSALSSVGIQASLLPLFGNSPLPTASERAKAEAFFAQRGIEKDTLVAGVYGSLHHEWRPGEALASFLKFAASQKRPAAFIVIGRNGVHASRTVMKLRAQFGNRLPIAETGSITAGEVSAIFSRLDFGIAASPWALIEKSGSAIAMLEAGLPTLVIRDDWRLRSGPTPLLENQPLLAPFSHGFDWPAFLTRRRSAELRLPAVAKQFLQAIAT